MLEDLRHHPRAPPCVLSQRVQEVQVPLGALKFGRVSLQVCGHRYEELHHQPRLHRQSHPHSLGNPLRSPWVLRTNYNGLLSPLPFGIGA